MEENQFDNITISKETSEQDNQVDEQPVLKDSSKTKDDKKSILCSLIALYKGEHRKKAIIVTLIIFLLIVLIIGFAISKEGTNTFDSESTLLKVVAINDLETFEYPYSAVATVKNDKGKSLYYVKYDAIIVMSVDFGKIVPSIDNDNKVISIIVPHATIKSYNINYDALEFMHEKKYDNDDLLNIAKKAVKEDLDSRLSNEKQEMFDIARENAIAFLRARTLPIAEQLFSGYKLDIK